MDNKNKILCIEEIEKLKNKFISSGWITVCDENIFSALATDDKVMSAMDHYGWDVHYGGQVPYVEDSDQGPIYYGLSNFDYESIVYYRETLVDNREPYCEISHDFILFHNLLGPLNCTANRKYILVDENGGEDECIEITGKSVRIKVKLIKEYLWARQLNLLLFIDKMNYSSLSYADLGITPVQNQVIKQVEYIYNFSNIPKEGFLNRNQKSGGWIMGKCLLRYPKSIKKKIHTYEEFIISYDENGDEITFSCDEQKLNNGFGANAGAPSTLTPVYFKKEVLDKYYNSPEKYSVQDGYLSCGDLWGIRIDNNRPDYVIVMLCDLGKIHSNEQKYWKTFNVAPPKDGGLSITAFTRWICGHFCDPVNPDLRFKAMFLHFNTTWKDFFGWSFFIPLTKDDQHRFESLHSLTKTSNEQEFDEQVLSLVKLSIDSLNQKEFVKAIDVSNEGVQEFLKKKNAQSLNDISAGIDKLEFFLISKKIGCEDIILFFRKVQSLRSNYIAHRKSSDSKSIKPIVDYFQMDKLNKQCVLDNMFERFIECFNHLSNSLISK